MTARTDPAEPGRTVIEQAAMWQARLADEECTEDDRAAFDHWLNEHPSHRIAFDRMSSIAGRLLDRDAIERTALQAMLSRRSRRTAFVAIVVLGGAGLAASMASHDPWVRAHMADERTTTGEIRSVTLAADDQVTLDSDSAADLDEGRRSVRLWRGGVMAKVAKGSAQPFVVRTSQGTARALGTQFSVRIEADATIVAVIESRVEACASQGARRCLTLEPGQSARLDRSGVQRLADIDPATETAWSDGLLIADDMPLAQVIDRLNLYRPTPIRFDAAELDGLKVSGTFPLTDANRALASIRAALPVAIERSGESLTIHRR